jgi:prepilin-type processing-associated H-X9-DG protein
VSGIPGARGFGEPGSANVAFADGRFFYLVGAAYPPGSAAAPSRGEVVAAAKHLFTRLNQA